MSKKPCPFAYTESTMKTGQDFLHIQCIYPCGLKTKFLESLIIISFFLKSPCSNVKINSIKKIAALKKANLPTLDKHRPAPSGYTPHTGLLV